MENLVKQIRVRFSGLGQDSDEGRSYVRERKLPLQKTQSFKGGKKVQSWFRRQFSGEMSRDNDGNYDFATAIAVAAFAITALEEGSQAPRKLSEGPETSLTRTMSRKEDSTAGRISRRFSGEASMKKPEVAEQITPEGWTDNQKMPQKGVRTVPSIKKSPTFADKHLNGVPSIKKSPTFADKHLNGTGSTKFGTTADARPTVYDTFPTAGGRTEEKTTASVVGETKADAWEKDQMTRINKRHERMTSTILSWEKEKKAKAKRRTDRIESEIERRRARAVQRFRNDITRIDQIAGGARAVAEERRRDEEMKTKEKANKIRSTGKFPVSCFCF
ncbi:hypothetical protein IFM89_004552 [Coptis chinensis]|uniref:Remorin C-terminal domain-containing protein n=1 Tax=Coptis chinensis TaxID=261450 RepID=A0A835H4M4_9MAGN|nr:hypothetical protein IFM89_004552 [Coptis chinensis]